MSRGIYCILTFEGDETAKIYFAKVNSIRALTIESGGQIEKVNGPKACTTPFGLFAANWVCLVSVALLLLVMLGLAFWFSN